MGRDIGKSRRNIKDRLSKGKINKSYVVQITGSICKMFLVAHIPIIEYSNYEVIVEVLNKDELKV